MRAVVIGSGGHAAVVLDAVLRAGELDVACLVDRDPARVGAVVLGLPVRAQDELEALRDAGVEAAVLGVGGVGDMRGRSAVLALATELGLALPPVVHPDATVAPSATLGAGAQVLARAVVNPRAEIGDGAIVNTAAVIEHDCRIGRCAHVAPAAALAGDVLVGDLAHVGLNASVIQGRRVGAGAIVGAGAVVLHDVPAGATVVGAPARVVRWLGLSKGDTF